MQNQPRCGFKGLWALAAKTDFAGRTRAAFAKRPVPQTLAAIAVIRLSRTAVTRLNNVPRMGHLLLARPLGYSGEAVDRQRQE